MVGWAPVWVEFRNSVVVGMMRWAMYVDQWIRWWRRGFEYGWGGKWVSWWDVISVKLVRRWVPLRYSRI